jgi:hypothetical protein
VEKNKRIKRMVGRNFIWLRQFKCKRKTGTIKKYVFMKNGTIIPKWNKYSDITYKKGREGRVVKLIGIHCSGNEKKMIVK